MSNTITGLIPDIYEALDVVSRENVGFVMAVSSDNSAERAAMGQNVRVPIYEEEASTDISPGVTPPDDGDNTTGHLDIIIDNAKRVPVRINGIEARGLNHGPGVLNYRAGRFAQGFRHLANLMEGSLAQNYKYACRNLAPSGASPFLTSMGDAAQMLKMLKDNGTPMSDLRMVVNSSVAANMRSLGILTKANEAGTDSTLRTGSLLDISGFRIGESGAYDSLRHTPGTGTGWLVNDAALLRGTNVINVDSGTGTILPGDIVTFDGDTNRYVAHSLVGGVLTIGKPGLLQNIADNAAITVVGAYDASVGFARHAIQLAARAPELPQEGDMADDRQLVTDPFSGITFEIALYRQYRQIQYEISIAWGSKVVKPDHLVSLAG